MEDIVFRFFLLFSHDTVIIPFLVLGYIWWSKEIFFHALGLILMNMLLNCALKVTFKVPLDPSISPDWFAFPSGHMQLSVVFYGWSFKSTRHLLLRGLCVCICIGIAGGILYFNYHQPYDIAGGIAVGLLWLWMYQKLLKSLSNTSSLNVSGTLIVLATTLMFYMQWAYGLKDHAWMAYYALIGVQAGGYAFGRNTSALHLMQKGFATAFFVIIFLILHKVFLGYTLMPCLFQLKWMLVGLCIPLSVFLFQPRRPAIPNKPMASH